MAGTAEPRDTARTGSIWLDGLLWGSQWSSAGATAVVSVYIAGRDGAENVSDGQGSSVRAYEPYARELAAIQSAMSAFEAVCGIDFRMTGSKADADLVWAMVGGADSPGAYGWSTPPGTAEVSGEARSLVAINYETFDPSAGPGRLARGGFDYATFLHELGHAVGLAHPHDMGGLSSVFPGVEQAFGDLGDFGMNQGIFTVMSYNDGWRTGPQGPSPSPSYGHETGPMALDIAALQHMYGANLSTRTGDDRYYLPGANGLGTFYSCIWDAGGTDLLLGAAGRANHIDLRAATLEEGRGGGGFMSYAAGIQGGFTIAHGVEIEGARGGALADLIQGNAAANSLRGLGGGDKLAGAGGADRLGGGDGHDTLLGGGGDDHLTGAAGADRLTLGAGRDRVLYTAARDSAPGLGRDRLVDFEPGQDVIVLTRIDADPGTDGDQGFRLDEGGGFSAGAIRQRVLGGDLQIEMNLDADALAEMSLLVLGRTAPLGEGDFAL